MIDMLGVALLLMSAILVIQSGVGSFFAHKKIRMFHESGVAILLGMILSAICKFCFDYSLKLNKQVFLYGFLPIIVFAEGFSLKKRHFFKNMMPIILYGLLGTIITMATTAILTQIVTEQELVYIQIPSSNKVSQDQDQDQEDDTILSQPIQFMPKEILLFASALSSKDSFMASTMVDHHSFPRIFHIIFGEGIVNDATALLLFDSFDQLVDEEKTIQWNILPNILLNFIKSLFISLSVGISFGVICILILKHLTFIQKTVIHEALVIFFCSFCSYSLVECIHLSGVVSLLFCGIVCGHFAFYNLSEKGMICCNYTFHIISSGAENCLFAYIGFTTFNTYDYAWSFSFIGFVLVFLIASRILSVFMTSLITDLILRCFGKRYDVSFRDQIVLALTGMSRGVLGYILVQRLDTYNTQDDFYLVLQSTVVALIVLTTFLFGLITPKIVDHCLVTPDPLRNSNSLFVSNQQVKTQENGQGNKIQHDEEQNCNEGENNIQQKEIIINKQSEKDAFKKQIKEYLLTQKPIDQSAVNKSYSLKFHQFYVLKVKPFLIRDFFERYPILQQCKIYFKNDKFDIRRPEAEALDQLLLHKSIEQRVATFKSNSINESPKSSISQIVMNIEENQEENEINRIQSIIIETYKEDQQSLKEKQN
ncbi:hypothetical protein ABPG72_022453 [Tetrahymena utriculariae]